ncbi:hypothetical protein LWI29_033241 [Acer saccharum]|uniref:Uncharacterized protein n=1 Tax=Acer saccharum TaxID=4024 RepID=A0AA39RRY3_ACESA|nr:hypothetical protein LWI29_033241 [Acer saccharum]
MTPCKLKAIYLFAWTHSVSHVLSLFGVQNSWGSQFSSVPIESFWPIENWNRSQNQALQLVELAIFRNSSNKIKISVVLGGGLIVWSSTLGGILSKFTFGEGNCVVDYIANIGLGLHSYTWWNSFN